MCGIRIDRVESSRIDTLKETQNRGLIISNNRKVKRKKEKRKGKKTIESLNGRKQRGWETGEKKCEEEN